MNVWRLLQCIKNKKTRRHNGNLGGKLVSFLGGVLGGGGGGGGGGSGAVRG